MVRVRWSCVARFVQAVQSQESLQDEHGVEYAGRLNRHILRNTILPLRFCIRMLEPPKKHTGSSVNQENVQWHLVNPCSKYRNDPEMLLVPLRYRMGNGWALESGHALPLRQPKLSDHLRYTICFPIHTYRRGP